MLPLAAVIRMILVRFFTVWALSSLMHVPGCAGDGVSEPGDSGRPASSLALGSAWLWVIAVLTRVDA